MKVGPRSIACGVLGLVTDIFEHAKPDPLYAARLEAKKPLILLSVITTVIEF